MLPKMELEMVDLPPMRELDRFIRDAKAWLAPVPIEASVKKYRRLHGVNVQAIRHARAYLTLRRAGMPVEAMVSSRAALEHAVTAQWSYFVPGGVERLNATISHDMQAYYDAWSKWLGAPELAERAREALAEADEDDVEPPNRTRSKPKQPQLPKFTGGILRSLDSHPFLAQSYKVLSLATHVTHTTGLGFVDEVDGVPTLTVEPVDDFSYPSTYVAAAAAMLGSWVQALILNDERRQAELDRASDRLLLPVSIADGIGAEWMKTDTIASSA